MSQKQNTNEVQQSLIAGLVQVPFYPLNYVKVLIQIGHEPLPPFRSRDILGRDKLFYPNSFSYLRHIYYVEGMTGLYRGMGMKFISHTIGTTVYSKLSKFMDENEEQNNVEVKDKNSEKTVEIFFRKTSKEMTIRCWSVIFSHPFHVMALRCMSQFVGGETNYSSWNVFQNAVEIYKGEGISGFFNGLIPRLLFEASTIAITNGIAYLLKTYVFDEKEVDLFIDYFASFFASSVTYPLSVVSTVSCISGSSLLAGQPPKMPMYKSWIEVFKHLYETNNLKRGSASFFRIYTAPVSYSFQSLY